VAARYRISDFLQGQLDFRAGLDLKELKKEKSVQWHEGYELEMKMDKARESAEKIEALIQKRIKFWERENAKH
jgi:hypothetical protein